MHSRKHEIAGLYQSERERLVRQVTRRVGSDATARDLVQDLFLRLWEKATFWHGDPAAYLTRCARNAAIDHARAERRRTDFIEGLLPEQHVAPLPTPMDILAARDAGRCMELALAALPRQTRHIFLLNRVHGRTFVEIADLFGISQRAVARHMARAVRACQDAIER